MGRKLMLSLATCLTTAAALFACSEDEAEPTNPAASGSGGSAGGGSGGTAGTAGASGDAGTGGNSGASTDSGTSGAGGTAGASGDSGGSSQGKRFVPEGITVQYVGKGPSGGLEIIAFTLLQEYGAQRAPAFIVAVKNSGPDPICIVDVPSTFLDAAGATLATTIGAGKLSAPVYNTFGSPAPCLGTGDVGMGVATLNLGNLQVSQVRRIDHGFTGNIDPNATKLTNVLIQNVQIMSAATGSVRATGRVVNNGSGTISDPDVAIYAVDPAGRPYGAMTAIDLRTIAPGGTWDFQTLSYMGQVQDHVDYVLYDVP